MTEQEKQFIEMINRTKAKTDYFLKYDELDKLEHIEKKNPYRSRGPKMRLYKLDDVIELFCNKYEIRSYEIEDKLKELENKKQNKKNTKINKRSEEFKLLLKENNLDESNIKHLDKHIKLQTIVERLKRQQELTKALQEKGLQLRTDSTLCNSYINDNIGSINNIVDIMHEMDWLFKNTNYKKIMQEEIEKEIREIKNYGGYYDIDDVRHDASSIAKYRAIKEWKNKHKNFIGNLPTLISTKINEIK